MPDVIGTRAGAPASRPGRRVLGRVLGLGLLTVVGAVMSEEQGVALLGYHTVVPSHWQRQEPSSAMRLLQFAVPGGEAAPEDGADFVVYYFGPGQGGSLDANVERWVSQFSNPDGSAVEPVMTPIDATMPATLVELTGSYARGVGIGPGGDPLPNRTLLAAVVETPGGNLYPQLHGPAERVAAEKDHLLAFITRLAPSGE